MLTAASFARISVLRIEKLRVIQEELARATGSGDSFIYTFLKIPQVKEEWIPSTHYSFTGDSWDTTSTLTQVLISTYCRSLCSTWIGITCVPQEGCFCRRRAGGRNWHVLNERISDKVGPKYSTGIRHYSVHDLVLKKREKKRKTWRSLRVQFGIAGNNNK